MQSRKLGVEALEALGGWTRVTLLVLVIGRLSSFATESKTVVAWPCTVVSPK